AANGVVLYVLVQRAAAAGAAALGQTRQLLAGEAGAAAQPAEWQQVAGTPDALSTDYPSHAGVYRAGDQLLALNRPPTEDQAPVLSDDRVAGLFQGLDFTRVDDRAGSLIALIQE